MKNKLWILLLPLLYLVSCKNYNVDEGNVLHSTKLPTSIPENRSWRTDTPDPFLFPIIISNIVYNEYSEKIVVENISDQDQFIGGFAILNPQTMEHFIIPEKILKSRSSYIICNGKCNDDEVDVKWLDKPVINEYGDHLVLLNQAGRVIWNYVYITNNP